MKIFICTSKHIYDRIPPIKEALENMGHIVTLPNRYENALHEEEMKVAGSMEHAEWKGKMLRLQKEKVNFIL